MINTLSLTYPHLTSGASIIVTGSVAGMIPGTVQAGTPEGRASGGVGYGFAKQVIVKLVHDLALLLADETIRVNVVHPTNVRTDLMLNDDMYKQWRPDLKNPTKEDAIAVYPTLQAFPIPFVEPIDIANAVLWLASDESRLRHWGAASRRRRRAHQVRSRRTLTGPGAGASEGRGGARRRLSMEA